MQANNNSISTLSSNNTSSNALPTVNHPPVVKVGPDQTVNENATVMLVGFAIDPEPADKVSYSWMQIAGPAITLKGADTDTPSFTAPSNLPSDTPLKFTLTAKDDKGAESTNPVTIAITVKHINHPPVADAGQDQTVNAGYVVSLDGTKSKDPDGDQLTFSWIQTNGPNITLNGADRNIATFTAPSNISSDTDLIFRLTVTDNKNATSNDEVKVTVKYIPPPNQAPVADAGTDKTVNADDIVTLDGTASKDPDGDTLEYSWEETYGPPVTLNGADTPTPSFMAPSIGYNLTAGADFELKFSLTVKDDKGESSSPSIVTITVKVPKTTGMVESVGPPASPQPTPEPSHSNMTTTEAISPSKEQYSFIRTWGSNGTGNGQFSNPYDVAIDSSGNVYVSDYGNHRIQKFTTDGTFITKWGSSGSGDGQFNSPYGIAIDSVGNVYIVDSQNERIQKFTTDGTFITKWGSFGSGDGQFFGSIGIAIDSQNNVYLADNGNNRIQKFTADGTFITKWGSQGSSEGQFSYPEGITVDSSGNVYVADTGNSRIQVFAPS